MSIVVGVAPGHPSETAVRLGVLLARSYDRELVVASINSAAWPPAASGVDAEYQEFLIANAEAALDAARVFVPADIAARYRVHSASSARRGLLEVCAEEGAMRLVVGSAGDAGDGGVIALGSVSTGLLQSADLPVAIAPHGFAPAEGARLSRVSAAYSGSDTSAELMLGAAGIASELGIDFRIVSFRTRPRGFQAAGAGFDAESGVTEAWEAAIRKQADEIFGEIEHFKDLPHSLEIAVGSGESWHAALRSIDWRTDEALTVGSSSLGLFGRISLGSHAAKIVRNSPVPVVMVPRRATEGYAAQAEGA